MSIERCLKTPIIGMTPSCAVGATSGIILGTLEILRTPFSDDGAVAVQRRFTATATAITLLFCQFIYLNPYGAGVEVNSNITLSNSIEKFFDMHIEKTGNPLMKRIYVLAALPSLLVTRIADLALGALALVAAIISAGMVKSINTRAGSHLEHGFKIIGDLPVCLARLARPDAVQYGIKED